MGIQHASIQAFHRMIDDGWLVLMMWLHPLIPGLVDLRIMSRCYGWKTWGMLDSKTVTFVEQMVMKILEFWVKISNQRMCGFGLQIDLMSIDDIDVNVYISMQKKC